MNKWFEFYKSRIGNISYEQYFNQKYGLFLDYLSNHIKVGDRVLEIGCGTSLVTKTIYRNNILFKVFDNNPKMLELSDINLKNKKITKKLFDARNPLKERYDMIYSHGVLEHFTISEIREIIKNQLKVCSHLVHYVPSNKYEFPSFGDELLLPKEDWNKDFKPSKIIEFNKGYDLILIWENK